MNIERINHKVLSALRNRGNTDEEISAMTPDQAFDEFCMWYGLIGWGDTLRNALNNLRAADAWES